MIGLGATATRGWRHRLTARLYASNPARGSQRALPADEADPQAPEGAPPVDLVIDGVSRRRRAAGGEQFLFDGLSACVPRGERLAVLGPNGSGKTSLLEIVLGLDEAEKGRVVLTAATGTATAYMPQDYRNALLPWLSVEANLALNLHGFKRQGGSWFSLASADRERIRELAQALDFEVELDRHPYELSGGEQQSLVFAQALMRRPGLLVMDEPFSALDAHRRERSLQVLHDWLDLHRPTFLIVSNQVEEAVFLADSVVVLSPGNGHPHPVLRVPLCHPRPLEWRYSTEYRDIVRQVVAEFAR